MANKKQPFIKLDRQELINFIENDPQFVRQKLLSELDDILIDVCMDICGSNQTRVAEVLGVNRGTLRNRMRNLGYLPEKADAA